MIFLSMMEAKLPPGFRFHPRDDELICDYLTPKVSGDGNNGNIYGCPMMIDVDLNKCEPWDLPEIACVGGKEWYFFSLRDRKYATGQRTNRATLSGYWKATGKDRSVVRKGVLVGMRKTLVFYQGRAPKGKKTDWVMHEFRMEGPAGDKSKFSYKEDWVLCRVFYKSRTLSAIPNSETCYDDTGSSSLPPLTETYIGFEQNPINFEQVPCFSNYPPNPPHLSAGSTNFDNSADLSSCLDPIACDKKVIKAVLNHLTKLDGNRDEVPPNLAELCSESYLSPGLPSIWYPFQS